MPTRPLGAINPGLLAQCPEMPVPPNATSLPIAMTCWGETGPAVLMVHGGVQGGIGGGPINFAGQRPLADRGWQLRLMDRPGFGGSPSRGPDDMVADAGLIAERLQGGCHLIGHSFGGAGALLAAARRPDAVRSLILIEPALQPLATILGTGGMAAAILRVMLAKLSVAIIGKSPSFLTGAVSGVVLNTLLTARSPAEFATNFARSMSRGDAADNPSLANITSDPQKAYILGCSLLRARAASPVEMKSAAETVRHHKIPVLVISAGSNEGQEATAKLVARATGGLHRVVACDSHFIQQDNPTDFNKVADEFMRAAETRVGTLIAVA